MEENPPLAGPSSGQMFNYPNRVEFREGSQNHFTNVHGNADTHVHSVATGHQPTAMNGIVTGIENTASSFLDAPCDIWSESASYSCQLLRQGRGFPLYVPGPPGNLPDEYQRSGVSIGDVGTVTPDGEFDFFFNIYLEADHPINANYVPDDFSPLKKCCIARDIIPSSQDPGSHVSTSSVQKLEPDPQFNEFPGGHFMFSCGAPKGAVLALPHGAHLQKLRNLETLRTYVAKHAESWYKYIRVTRGRELENGSLYLVTGWEKAPSWGMASFRGAGGGFQLAFQPTATTLTPRADSTSAAMLDPTSTPRIDSTSSYQYRWSGVSRCINPAQTKRYNPSSTNGPLNQTTFIHGLSISVGTGIWAALFGKVKICEIVKFQSGGANGNSISHTNGSSSSSSSPGISGGGGGGTTNGRTYHAGESGHVVLSNLAPISKIFHPGKLINSYILQKTPQALVVMSHDDDWRDILRDDPSSGPTIQNALELLQRIDDQFSITEKDGATFLLPTPAPSTSDEVGHISPTTLLETHPSTWLAEEQHLPTPVSLIVSQSEQAPAAVKEAAENATLDSTANIQHTSDVTVGRPVDAEQDKINADTDAHSIQSMSRRSQGSDNEELAFADAPGQDVLHQKFEPFAPDHPPSDLPHPHQAPPQWGTPHPQGNDFALPPLSPLIPTPIRSASTGRPWLSSSSLFNDPYSVSLIDSDLGDPTFRGPLTRPGWSSEAHYLHSVGSSPKLVYGLAGLSIEDETSAEQSYSNYGGSSFDSRFTPYLASSYSTSPLLSPNYSSLAFEGISVVAGRSRSHSHIPGFDADYPYFSHGDGDSRRLAARAERRRLASPYPGPIAGPSTGQAERPASRQDHIQDMADDFFVPDHFASDEPAEEKRFRPVVATVAGRRASAARRKDKNNPGAFVCDICSADFTAKHNLRNHMNSHNLIKTFICGICGESFGTKHTMKRHERKCSARNSQGGA